MGLFSGTESLVGLDLGSSAVKAVELRRVRSGFELVRAGMEPLEPGAVAEGAIEDADSVSAAIGRVVSRSRIRSRKVAISVSGHSVIVKKLTLPAMSREELEESIQWEARQVIPFDLSDVHLDHQVLGSAPGRHDTRVLLVAARKERVASRLEAIAGAGLSPVIVDVDGFALQNAYEANYGPGSSVTDRTASYRRCRHQRGGDPGRRPAVYARLVGWWPPVDRIAPEAARDRFRGSRADEEGKRCGSPGSRSVGRTSPIGDRDTAAGDSQDPGPVRGWLDEDESVQQVYVSGGCSELAGLIDRMQNGLDLPLEPLEPLQEHCRRERCRGRESLPGRLPAWRWRWAWP